MPPPVERSTGILTTALAAWIRIQDFVRSGVELVTMGLNQVREMKMLFSIACLRRSGRVVTRG